MGRGGLSRFLQNLPARQQFFNVLAGNYDHDKVRRRRRQSRDGSCGTGKLVEVSSILCRVTLDEERQSSTFE